MNEMNATDLRATRITMRKTATPAVTGRQILERIYDEHAAGLLRYARALIGSPEDAEDAVQEVFIRLARDVGKLERIADLQRYLLKSTRNAVYGLLRTKQRRERLDADMANQVVHGRQERRDDAGAVLEAFADLAPDQREVLALKIFYGLTFKEISGVVGRSQNTVSSRYRYGIERIRARVAEE